MAVATKGGEKKTRNEMKLPMAATTKGRGRKTRKVLKPRNYCGDQGGVKKCIRAKERLRRAKKTSALSVASENTHSEAGAFELQMIPKNASETRDRHELD